MSNYENVETRATLPETYASGEPIEYVWIVYRPPATSTIGDVEILGAFDSAPAAKKHARVAERAGAVEIEAKRVSDGDGPKLD